MQKIKPLIDVPSQAPQMGFPEYADALSNLIINADDPQFTIGIFGGYGSGKSTLLSAINQAIVKKSSADESENAITRVDFNAWRYDQEENLFLPFLAAIYRSISDDPTSKEHFVSAFRAVLRNISFEFNVGITKIKINDGNKIEDVNKKLSEGGNALIKSYLDGYQDIQEVLQSITCNEQEQIKKKMVVFIDDLDRCVPEKAFQLLESLKSCMDVPGFIFILALDPRVIETYLDKKYGTEFGINAEEYLQKIVQVPFHLPRFKPDDIVKEINKLLETSEDETFSNFCNNQIEFLPHNMRQIKRIYNTYQVLIKHKEFDKEVLLTLLLIQVRWPYAYYALHLTGVKFVDSINAIFKGESLESINSIIRDLPQLKNEDLYNFCQRLSENQTLPNEIEYYLEFLGWPIDIETKFDLNNI